MPVAPVILTESGSSLSLTWITTIAFLLVSLLLARLILLSIDSPCNLLELNRSLEGSFYDAGLINATFLLIFLGCSSDTI